ncbi:MAG: dephospho-CoA kinase [Microthrixaceae bacterium]
MLLVGLTGGIGSGKSTVSALLAERGAVIVDADAIVHQLQAPGTPVLEAMVERFGQAILNDDGTLNRAAVADQVFGDEQALADLNAIVHPAVRAELAMQVLAQADTHNVVVMDVPLLTESGMDGLSGVVVVDVDPEVAVERLVEHRGFSEADARARISSQSSREERRKLADWVIDNSGDLADLEVAADELWANLDARRNGGEQSDPTLRYPQQ